MMLDGRLSGCINHPAVEAATRCKQCGRPVCAVCTVTGPTGRFCSETCKEKHQAFVERAQAQEQSRRYRGRPGRLRRTLIKMAVFVAVVVALGFAAVYFDVPVAGALVRRVLAVAAPYLPGI